MKNPIFFALFFLFATGNVQAQVPYFEEYFLLKKNESVQVNAIFQDKSGFIWFATSKGLFKFNGRTYQRFTKADSLPDDNVTAIAQDSLGRIWTGHRNGMIAFQEKDFFVPFTPPEGSSTEPVSDLIFDKRGYLWFSTLNDGLYYYRNNRLYRLDSDEGMPDIFVYDILEDSIGNIWAGTDGGLVKCSVENQKITLKVFNYSKGLPDNIVKKIAAQDTRMLWLATEDAGLVKFDTQKEEFTTLEPSWNFGSTTDFIVNNNKLWISTIHEGLLVYDVAEKSSTVYRLNSRSFATLLKDKEGNIWTGSKHGVLRTPGDHILFTDRLLPFLDNDVLAVAAEKNKTIWYSTKEGLFTRSLSASGDVISKRQLANTPYAQFTVISLYVDELGFVWAGLYGQGVLRIDSMTGRIQYFNKELRNGNVLSITGNDNEIWLATLGGSERITLDGGKLFFTNFNRQNGLSSDFIYQVFIDSNDRIWFATDGKGIDMMDKNGFHHYEDGLPSKVVYGFAEDSQKQLWVNVQGNGIYQLQGDKFLPLQSPFTLRDNNVNCLASDGLGNIVVMHDLGIDVLDFKNKRTRFYDEQIGIEDRTATLNAVSKDNSRGNLIFGTDGGILQYRSDPKILEASPRVAIQSVKIFNENIDWISSPVLGYDENNISVSFYGLWYQDVEGILFQYKLDNYDEDWITTGDNQVTFSKLPPGDYTFHVRSSSNLDFSNSGEASFSLTIRPPFWKTAAFYVSVLFLIATGVFLFVKARERRLRFEKKRLEMKVVQRTLEIQRKTEEIQAQNEEIMAQAEEIKGINENLEMLVKERTSELEKKNIALEEYAFINAHKLRSPLASILGLINLIGKTNLDAEGKEINNHLQQRATELDDVVRSITKAIERGEKK